MASIITLTTDFGADSPYVAQMKASILGIASEVHIVDVTHSVTPQNVFEGAIVLADTAFQFSPGTVHVAVVDPGVGTERGIIAAQVNGHWFVAPDNGVLTGVVDGREVTSLRGVENRSLWRDAVSNTFHGRDIMGPVAAHLAIGREEEMVGPPQVEMVRLKWPQCQRADGVIEGEVIYVDSFGNLLANIRREDVGATRSDQLSVTIENQNIPLYTTYGSAAPGEVISLFGSSDRLEIAVVEGSAARELGIDVGTRVAVSTVGETDC